MITADYVVLMARYNAWQNNQLVDIVHAVDEDDLRQDRGAFFGSIMHTLNHILWGDTMWMSRFSDAFAAPDVPAAEHITYTDGPDAWCAARTAYDQQIKSWAAGLTDADLEGELSWRSGLTQQDMSMPRAQCVAHLFSHQTHHRGQVHAMLTAAGHTAPVTDLCFLPEGA